MVSKNKNIDLTCYIAIGDSLTTGYEDGALFYEGQICSYPNLMAGKFGCEFTQPLMSSASVGIGFFGNSRLILEKGKDGTSSKLTYVSSRGDIDAIKNNIYLSNGPFNNLGVPGAKVITVIAPGYGNNNNGEGNFNPFFFRMASNPLSASILSDAFDIEPSFFSLFIGNNDVLAYALSGGTSDWITPIDGPPGIGFEESLTVIVNTLLSKTSKGVICNLPSLSSIPFFNTIKYNSLFLDLVGADLLSVKYKHLGVTFQVGFNPFLIEDPSHPNGVRKIEEGEFILLEIFLDKNKIEFLNGLMPIPKIYYLSKKQIELSQAALNSFNTIIKNIATKNNLAFVDAECLLKTIKIDRVYDGKTIDMVYKTGGVFSLDGLHINQLGQALLANEFIEAINNIYKTAIQKVNITKFRGKVI